MYPPFDPYDHGMLDVGDGNVVYWEVAGNPEGKTALSVHGGPGQGCLGRHRHQFDPRRYRVVQFDQRGCGRSTPHASDPATDMSVNTTEHLIADMERVREHLAIERWLLFGGSWGSTLALAYAERHPERVSEIVLPAVTTTRRYEIDWLYRGAGRFFPEQWERFRTAIPDAGDDMLTAYAARMGDPDPDVRLHAAREWIAWEDVLLSEEPGGKPGTFENSATMLAFARICAHYFSHGAWLEEGALIRDAGRLAGIPGVLIHGRLDLSAPLDTAWELTRTWPDASLFIVDNAGHMGTSTTRDHIDRALHNFASGDMSFG